MNINLHVLISYRTLKSVILPHVCEEKSDRERTGQKGDERKGKKKGWNKTEERLKDNRKRRSDQGKT